MKRIRIGNDIHLSWTILRNGEPEDFGDKNVEVQLIHTLSHTFIPIEWGINENVIEFDFFGKDQKRTGAYKVILTENRGEEGMSTLDNCEAFYLVDHTCKERNDDTCGCLKVQSVSLTGEFALSGGAGIAGSRYGSTTTGVYDLSANGGGAGTLTSSGDGGASRVEYSSDNSDGEYRGSGGGGYVYTSEYASYYPSGCLLNSSYYLTSASTTSGSNETTFPSPSGGTENGHSGNGYCRITKM